MKYWSLSICLFALYVANVASYPDVQCQGSVCNITNVQVSGSEAIALFNTPIAIGLPTSDEVKTIRIRDSSIYKLTSDICKGFPKLEVLDVESIGIAKVSENALKDCHDLKEIYLGDNQIRLFKKHTFNRNKKLEIVSLWGNRLHHLDTNLFSNLVNLKRLILSANRLVHVCAYTFRDLTSLRTLTLHHNLLVDLNADKILSYLPNLFESNLGDNDFRCERLKEIRDVFKAGKVTLHNAPYKERIRPFDEKIGGIECLNDENYEKLLEKSLVTVKEIMDQSILDLSAARETYEYYNNILVRRT